MCVFNFSIGVKRIKELKHEFLVFLRKLINVLYAIDGGGIEFDICIADEPVQCVDYGSWVKGFVPIFWNGNRDYLLVDCLNQNKGIFCYSPDDSRFDGIERRYDSFDHLFATVLQCFELGAYQLGRKLEDIHYDGEFVFSISRKMNPNSPYWQLA